MTKTALQELTTRIQDRIYPLQHFHVSWDLVCSILCQYSSSCRRQQFDHDVIDFWKAVKENFSLKRVDLELVVTDNELYHNYLRQLIFLWYAASQCSTVKELHVTLLFPVPLCQCVNECPTGTCRTPCATATVANEATNRNESKLLKLLAWIIQRFQTMESLFLHMEYKAMEAFEQDGGTDKGDSTLNEYVTSNGTLTDAFSIAPTLEKIVLESSVSAPIAHALVDHILRSAACVDERRTAFSIVDNSPLL